MKILLIDNYDSFTYNLLHYLEGESGVKVEVFRNDQLADLDVSSYSHIILSPGPGLPSEAGELLAFIEENKLKKMLGVCLGQQALAAAFAIPLKQLNSVVHGQAREVTILKAGRLFSDLPKNFKVGRYHSWVVDPDGLSSEFEVLAVDEEGQLMAIQHKELDLTAVQFHPESILTEHGRKMIQNWLAESQST